jgi:hypothetical protein
MATFKQTELNTLEAIGENGAGTIVTVNSESEIMEMSDDEMDEVNGGAMRSSNANFDRKRTAMSGSSFAGPEGAGSSFNFKQEEVHSSNQDFMSDDD